MANRYCLATSNSQHDPVTRLAATFGLSGTLEAVVDLRPEEAVSLSAGVTSSRSADVTLPQVPYAGCMHTDIEDLVVFCSECGHSEFVHADRGLPCLFSDCDCSGFDVSVQV